MSSIYHFDANRFENPFRIAAILWNRTAFLQNDVQNDLTRLLNRMQSIRWNQNRSVETQSTDQLSIYRRMRLKRTLLKQIESTVNKLTHKPLQIVIHRLKSNRHIAIRNSTWDFMMMFKQYRKLLLDSLMSGFSVFRFLPPFYLHVASTPMRLLWFITQRARWCVCALGFFSLSHRNRSGIVISVLMTLLISKHSKHCRHSLSKFIDGIQIRWVSEMERDWNESNAGEWQECAISNTIILIGLKTNEHFIEMLSHSFACTQFFQPSTRVKIPFDRGLTYNKKNQPTNERSSRTKNPKAWVYFKPDDIF